MATNKLGTLVYDLIADTKGFQQGVVSSRKEVTALKKVFLESRTPVEAFGIQMQGMQKLIESGARPVNMFSRSIADLAVKTKGGGREARAFVESLRQQASQIVQSVGHYRVLSKEDRERVDRLRAVARAIEREVDMQRNAIAEKLKAARQSAEADKQAKQQAIEAKRESDRRAEALKRESQALAEKARHEARVEEIQRRQRQAARQAGARMTEQQQASSLALVRRELEKTITPQQKLVTLASTARAEYAKGNITQQELVAIQRRVVAGLREINPELQRERDRIAAVNSQLQERIKREREIANLLQRRRQQATEEGRRASQQVEAERLNRVRAELNAMITPQQRIARSIADAREERRLGNITDKQFLQLQEKAKLALRQLNDQMVPYGQVVERTRGRIEKFGEGMALQVAALAKQISAISAAYAVLSQIRQGIAGALELGRATKEFEIFTGSAQTAMALMSGLRNLAAETPLTMGASTQTVRTLLQYGVAQNQVLDITRRIGDISGGSTERIQRLALAMGQITGNGRLMGQELRQLVEAGFNPLSIISKQTGLDMMELRIRMAEGRISAEDIRKALTTATSEGGRFADALKRIGEETPAGQLLKMRGELEKLRDDFFVPLTIVLGEFAGKTTASVRAARQFARTIVELQQSSNKFAKQVGKDVVLISKVFGTFGSLGRIFSNTLGFMIQIEDTVKEIEQARIEAAEAEKEAISEVDKSISERIALLRREREELQKGKEEFLILDYIRQGASDKYIEQLREELRLTKEAREEDEKRAEAKKKAERMAQQAQDDLKSAEQDRIKRAREIFDAVMGEASPLQTLQAGLQELKGLEDILDLGTIKKAREQLFKEFQEAETDKAKESQDATAAAKGSVEEFELLKQMDRESVAERRHKEAIDAAADIKDAVEEGNRDRKTTAEDLANAFSEAMPESLASPRFESGSYGGSFSIN